MIRAQLSSPFIAAAVLFAHSAAGQGTPACFAGQDASGGSALMRLQVERYGELFEIWGGVQTARFGVFRIKADGWSGAGRMYRGHEYESGVLYVQFSNYTGERFDLHVQGYGNFAFRRVSC